MTAYLLGLMYGTFMGLSCGYLAWKLPDHVKHFQTWRQVVRQQRPKISSEIDRILGGLHPERFVPNSLPKPFLRERVLAWWEDLLEETRPRTPEQVAEQTYRDILVGNR